MLAGVLKSNRRLRSFGDFDRDRMVASELSADMDRPLLDLVVLAGKGLFPLGFCSIFGDLADRILVVGGLGVFLRSLGRSLALPVALRRLRNTRIV